MKIVGGLLLVGGILLAFYGIVYNNSAQHQLMAFAGQFTGSSDPTGTICIGVGAVASLIGVVLLLMGGSTKKTL